MTNKFKCLSNFYLMIFQRMAMAIAKLFRFTQAKTNEKFYYFFASNFHMNEYKKNSVKDLSHFFLLCAL